MPNKIELKGKKVRTFEVMKRDYESGKTGTPWVLKCTECGEEKIATSQNIRLDRVGDCDCVK